MLMIVDNFAQIGQIDQIIFFVVLLLRLMSVLLLLLLAEDFLVSQMTIKEMMAFALPVRTLGVDQIGRQKCAHEKIGAYLISIRSARRLARLAAVMVRGRLHTVGLFAHIRRLDRNRAQWHRFAILVVVVPFVATECVLVVV